MSKLVFARTHTLNDRIVEVRSEQADEYRKQRFISPRSAQIDADIASARRAATASGHRDARGQARRRSAEGPQGVEYRVQAPQFCVAMTPWETASSATVRLPDSGVHRQDDRVSREKRFANLWDFPTFNQSSAFAG